MSLAAWQRASLTLLVLSVLEVAPRHGYGVSQAFVDAGLQPVRGAQLYPALAKLDDEGAIVAAWAASGSGPARKVYELTDEGRLRLARERAEWRAFVAAADAVGTSMPGDDDEGA